MIYLSCYVVKKKKMLFCNNAFFLLPYNNASSQNIWKIECDLEKKVKFSLLNGNTDFVVPDKKQNISTVGGTGEEGEH